MVVLVACLAYSLGLLTKGIHITKSTDYDFDEKGEPKYNKQPDTLDPEVDNYLKQNNGKIKF